MTADAVTPALPITGGCNCGAVRFEISEPFVSSSYCHCTRCQRRTGTGSSVNGRAKPGTVSVVQGDDQLRSWKPETGAEKFFCGSCGSALFSRSGPDGENFGVRLGALDADPGIRPQWRQYTAYAASWEPVPEDGLPRYPEARPPD